MLFHVFFGDLNLNKSRINPAFIEVFYAALNTANLFFVDK